MEQEESAQRLDASRLAFAYRRLVLWFGAELALFVASFGLHVFSQESVIGAIFGMPITIGFLVTSLALGYYGFRTAAALRSRVAWFWGMVMLVPYVNALALLWLRQHGCTSDRFLSALHPVADGVQQH